MERKLKHLEFIQAIISRMAKNSSLFKGWAVTIAAGLSAFAAVESRIALLTIAIGSTTMFWAMDGYYLWLERRFINLYKQVAVTNESEIDFFMPIDKSLAVRRWLKTCLRPHLLAFYGTIILVDVIGIIAIKKAEYGSTCIF
jgi:hypothetical protein